MTNPQFLRPFNKFCMDLSVAPTAFEDAMDWYEAIRALYEYLSKEVTPTVNNNTEVIKEIGSFVEHYFDNLNVQNEINNKLDQMVTTGSLQALLAEQYGELKSEVNLRITNIDNKVTSEIQNIDTTVQTRLDNMDANIATIKSASPSVVNAISEMTDTTKTYINASNGKWYYYDGSTWVEGGTYQGTEIADGSISVLQFDNVLKRNFAPVYSSAFTSTPFQGYAGVENNKVKISQEGGYIYYAYDLELNGIYYYNGKNNWAARGLVIADSEGNVIYESGGGSTINSKLIQIKKAGCKAYVSALHANRQSGQVYTIDKWYENSNIFRKLVSLSVTNKPDYTCTLVTSYNNAYLRGNTVNNLIQFRTEADNLVVKQYAMENGKRYKIRAYRADLAQPFVITNMTYVSSYVGSADEDKYVDYEFTAAEDGFIFLSEPYGRASSIEQLTDSDKLSSKYIIYEGDSITESRINRGNADNGGAYPKLIGDITGCQYSNYATGGATLAYKQGNTGRSIVRSLTNLDTSADMVVISGGVNDLWTRIPLGTLSNDFTGEVDDTTVIGACEKIFRYLINNFSGKPIIFVITPKVEQPYTQYNGYNQFGLHEALVNVCKKYAIPYFDAFDKSGFNGCIESQSNLFTGANAEGTPDGVHLNKLGYEKYFVPQILSLMNELV